MIRSWAAHTNFVVGGVIGFAAKRGYSTSYLTGIRFLFCRRRPEMKASVNNTPVRFEFVFNSNDSLKSKDNKYRINKYELKLK